MTHRHTNGMTNQGCWSEVGQSRGTIITITADKGMMVGVVVLVVNGVHVVPASFFVDIRSANK